MTQQTVTPELAVQASELRSAIAVALGTLTPREECVLRLRFGFDTDKEMTYEAIGGILGTSFQRAHQLKVKALLKLRRLPRSMPILAAAKAGMSTRKLPGGSYRGVVLDETIISAL